MSTTNTAIVAVRAAAARNSIGACDSTLQPRTDAERCRRAAMLARMAARELAGVPSVIDRTDGAADLARLREIAGNCDAYAESRERAA